MYDKSTIHAITGMKLLGLSSMIYTELKIQFSYKGKTLWLPPSDTRIPYLDYIAVKLPSPLVPSDLLKFKPEAGDQLSYYKFVLPSDTYMSFISTKIRGGKIVDERFYILRAATLEGYYRILEGIEGIGLVSGVFDIEGGHDTTEEKAVRKLEVKIDRRKIIMEVQE